MTELIAWADVPEGHYVWARRRVGGILWLYSQRLGNLHVLIGGLADAPSGWEFARAEQQPGEHAAELADALRAGFAALTKEG